jgi:ribosomal protein S18 acetylase RimI-like enzyme
MCEAFFLRPFDGRNAATILGWIESPEQLWHWAARKDFPVADPNVFHEWHADPDVTAYELVVDGELTGYGELWCEPDEPSAELARLIIAPAHRNRGLGRLLAQSLTEQCCEVGYSDVSVRVCPANVAALTCYRAAGFKRVTAIQERRLNADQPQQYAWMQRAARTVAQRTED